MQTVIGIILLTMAAPPVAEEIVVRKLVEALKDVDPEVRQNVGLSLAKLGTVTIDPLIEALQDSSPEKRSGAAYALALIGPPARAAMPALLEALNDKDTDVRRQVSYAISRILPPARPSPETPAPQPRGGLR